MLLSIRCTWLVRTVQRFERRQHNEGVQQTRSEGHGVESTEARSGDVWDPLDTRASSTLNAQLSEPEMNFSPYSTLTSSPVFLPVLSASRGVPVQPAACFQSSRHIVETLPASMPGDHSISPTGEDVDMTAAASPSLPPPPPAPTRPLFSVALVCQSNVNRSMEAHRVLADQHWPISLYSYGVGKPLLCSAPPCCYTALAFTR